MPKGSFRLLIVIAMAAAAASCGPSAVETPAQAVPDQPRATPTTTAPATPPSTTSTTSSYESFGEEIAVSNSPLGAVTWRQTSSFPLELIAIGEIPSPEHTWTYDWLARYKKAHEITGACFEIYEASVGYLGLGPCPDYWDPQSAWSAATDPQWYGQRSWGSPEWIWMREVWFSPDGESWIQTAMTFPDSTAAVVAQPWVVAERDGRWVVIGLTGVGEDADVPWDDRTNEEKWGIPGLIVPKSAEPVAWTSDDLSEWERVVADFGKEGFDTALTSVVAGDPGWFIFGIRDPQEPPRMAEWVAWASTDGIDWEELSMSGVYDAPCEPTRNYYCGMIKAHFLEDAIFAYAWTWPLKDEFGVSPMPAWRLLIGEL